MWDYILKVNKVNIWEICITASDSFSSCYSIRHFEHESILTINKKNKYNIKGKTPKATRVKSNITIMYRMDFRYLIWSLHKSENTVNSQKKIKCICVCIYI